MTNEYTTEELRMTPEYIWIYGKRRKGFKGHRVDTRGCWLWQGHVNKLGYASISYIGVRPEKKVLAHRYVYERMIEPIPEGLEIDHLCRVRHCVNPLHLEPVTHLENVRRGDGHPAKRWTHCKRGHPFSEENTAWRGKYRSCRACRNIKLRERRQKARNDR